MSAFFFSNYVFFNSKYLYPFTYFNIIIGLIFTIYINNTLDVTYGSGIGGIRSFINFMTCLLSRRSVISGASALLVLVISIRMGIFTRSDVTIFINGVLLGAIVLILGISVLVRSISNYPGGAVPTNNKPFVTLRFLTALGVDDKTLDDIEEECEEIREVYGVEEAQWQYNQLLRKEIGPLLLKMISSWFQMATERVRRP